VLELLQPLLNYECSKVNSPPLAPKHITAATTRPRKPREPKTPGEPKTKKTKLKGSSQHISGSGVHGPVMGVIGGSGAGGSMGIYDGDEDMSTSEMDHDDDGLQTRAGMFLLLSLNTNLPSIPLIPSSGASAKLT